MVSNDKITQIFCVVDDFCKEMTQILNENAIEDDNSIKRRNRKSRMSDSEVITIMVLFHLKGYRCLKHFYINHVKNHMRSEFPTRYHITGSWNCRASPSCQWSSFSRPVVWGSVRVFPFWTLP